ncbi:MAG TPA: aquaporin [Thermoanaerobaculia bacterium]|nr:aquaporin [Thermoanaerobaculia bacterium]
MGFAAYATLVQCSRTSAGAGAAGAGKPVLSFYLAVADGGFLDHAGLAMKRALVEHWPEYLAEAAGLALYMAAVGLIAVLLSAPASPLAGWLPGALARRAVMGVAVGATGVALVYSPWGRRSGGHFNPAMTFTFWRLGKVAPWDALFYGAAQAGGGVAGVLAVRGLLGRAFVDPPVRAAVTSPGMAGAAAAFAAELTISAGLMTAVLQASNSRRFNRFTGCFAGLLVAAFITFEAPLSGMSMNPARSFAAALPAGAWSGLWIYLLAPPAGMLLAARVYVARRGAAAVHCAKLDHGGSSRCIFRCRYPDLVGERPGTGSAAP